MKRNKKADFEPVRKKKNSIMWFITLMIMGVIVLMFFQGGKEKDGIFSGSASAVSGSQNTKILFNPSKQASKDWNLILVNKWNPVPDNYEINFTQLQNGHSVDSRIYPELQEMFDDARSDGILPMITSSYRTAQTQQRLFEEEIASYKSQGYSNDKAREIAATWVAEPGYSEHQVGLAVDISTADSQRQGKYVVWDWLNKNCYKYGFILRYPEDKTEITGISYEPWHYRYVGKEAAQEIFEQGICLEEYLKLYS